MFRVVSLLLLLTIVPLSAALIVDPAGDFLATFTGPHNGDLDVITAQAFFNGSTFTFTSMENGPIGTTPIALFVWGVDRGTHTAGFGAFRPGVLFDAVVILRPDLTGSVVDLSSETPVTTNLPAGSVTVSGTTITGLVAASLLPSLGVPPSQFGVNLWPRTGLGNNNFIADFAPDNSDAAVTVVPEPENAALLAIAAGGLLMLRKYLRAPVA